VSTHLDWPFFDDTHRELHAAAETWAQEHVAAARAEADEDAATRRLVRELGEAELLRHVVVAPRGGVSKRLDVRSICVVREVLARHWGLADFAFAMQGLGSGPVSLFGSEALRAAWLPRVASGDAIAAFALSEKAAGSNVAAIATTARRDGDGFVIDGEKTWISNAGIADVYVVFARTGEAPGAKGLSAFVVDAESDGLEVTERIPVSAPHPLGTLRFDGCRVGSDSRLGGGGDGFRVAMATLDVFRSTVGAAALGFARRALALATEHARKRIVFEQPLAEFQMTQQKLADMVADVDTSALAVYRAAWTKDGGADRVTREAAVAKLVATEAAQRVIDQAVQIHGGLGVVSGHPVEELYREIRPLRIYEGTSEIQRVIIAREHLKEE
jgi:acyl-CoA dehydrogenase